ncbi:MAG: hypothetical protein ACMUIU_06320 [bacterium]
MRIKDSVIHILILVAIMIIVFGLASEGTAQGPFLFPQYFQWGINPLLYPFSPIPQIFPSTAPLTMGYPPIPYSSMPAFSPLTRVGAATIIVSNPTAGIISVINPTVASTPTVPVVSTSPPPLLSLLATIYASALYEGALSMANPLLFALLQSLFL